MAASGDVKSTRIFDSLDELATDLAEYVAQLSEAFVRERGVFTIALTGGSLISLMGKLSEGPYNKTVDWRKWYVFWADERAVGKNHVDSNYRLAKDGLLSKVSILHSHIYCINDNLSLQKATREYERKIRHLVKIHTIDVSKTNDCPKFDLIILELGSDGHVASLFPHHISLRQKDDWVTYFIDSPEPPPERITFTLPVINSASNVAILATGDDKGTVLKQVFDHISDVSLPASLVNPSEGKLVWFLDNLAAAFLDSKIDESKHDEI